MTLLNLLQNISPSISRPLRGVDTKGILVDKDTKREMFHKKLSTQKSMFSVGFKQIY